MCLPAGCYDLDVDGGDWQNEVYWEFAGYSGGAPFHEPVCIGVEDGCAGPCNDEDED